MYISIHIIGPNNILRLKMVQRIAIYINYVFSGCNKKRLFYPRTFLNVCIVYSDFVVHWKTITMSKRTSSPKSTCIPCICTCMQRTYERRKRNESAKKEIHKQFFTNTSSRSRFCEDQTFIFAHKHEWYWEMDRFKCDGMVCWA